MSDGCNGCRVVLLSNHKNRVSGIEHQVTRINKMIKTRITEKVRYSETDQMGIVHHSNYARFYENGRVDLMAQIGIPYHEMENSGVIMPVVSVESQFIRPLYFGQTFEVETIVEALPTARLTVFSNIYVDDELVHKGKVVLGFMNKKTFKVCRPPKDILSVFENNFTSE